MSGRNRYSAIRGRCAALALSLSMALVVVSAAHAEPGFVGMQIQGMPPEAGAAVGLDHGILVKDVGLGTPAAEAGILRGDILTAVNGETLSSFEQLVTVVKASSPGDEIAFDLRRHNEDISAVMVLGEWPEHWKPGKPGFANLPGAGITIATLTEDVRKQLGIRWGAKGVAVTVTDVAMEGSVDLRRGDVILQVNQNTVWQPAQVLDLYRAAKDAGKKHVLMFVEGYIGYRFSLVPVK